MVTNSDPLGISATAELASNTEADTNALDTNVARGFIIYTTDICKRMKAASTSKNMSDTGSQKKAAVFINCLSVSLSVFLSVFVFVCVVTNYLNGRWSCCNFES